MHGKLFPLWGSYNTLPPSDSEANISDSDNDEVIFIMHAPYNNIAKCLILCYLGPQLPSGEQGTAGAQICYF